MVHGGGDVTTRFIEIDGVITEIPGKEVGVRIKQRDQGIMLINKVLYYQM